MFRYRSNYPYFEEHFKSDNIFHLITLLCENVCDNFNYSNKNVVSYKLLQKSRSIAYGILLKKKTIKYDDVLATEPLEELERLQFRLSLNAKTVESKNRATEIDKCVQDILDTEFLASDENKAILIFLLSLEDTGGAAPVENLLESGFTNYQTPHSSYPVFPNEIFKMPNQMSIYLGKKNIPRNPYNELFFKYSDDHYTEFKNPLNFFTNSFELSVQKYNLMVKNTPGSDSKMTAFTDIWDEQENAEKITFYKNRKNNSHLKGIEYKDPLSSNEESETITKINTVEMPFKCNISPSWDYLGCEYDRKERKFITECNSIHHISSLLSTQRSDVLILSYPKFLKEVKDLTISLPTDSFFINDSIVFEMKPNIAVEDISKHTLQEIVAEFLEMGTCYKRLKIMITENPCNLKLIYDGFVFKVLCKCIQKFLLLFRKFVTSHEDNSLLIFSKRMAILKSQLIAITRISYIHPNDTCDKTLPTSSNFLKYLYEKMNTIYEKENKMILTHILINCCNAYYSKFEKWLFNGYLDDPSNELFIEYIDHYRFNTKYFFDKAYLICNNIVPEFLRGYEEDILLCGKYTMLLKSFKPTHPLFNLQALELKTCLSYKSLNELKIQCEDYKKKGLEVCGKMVSIRDIFKEEKRQREQIVKTIEAKNKLAMNIWKANLEMKIMDMNQKKREKLELLRQQIAETHSNQLMSRKNNIKKELNYLIENIEKDNEELLKENLEREQKIEYYMELNRIVEEEQQQIETIVADLKNCLENSENGNSDNLVVKSQDVETSAIADMHKQLTLAKIESKYLEHNSDIENANTEMNEMSSANNMEINKIKSITSTIFSTDDAISNLYESSEKIKTEISDLEKNRNKMMNCDINRNFEDNVFLSIIKEEPTDLEINRNRNMGHGFNIGELTEFKINKQKVMELEYGYSRPTDISICKSRMILDVKPSYKNENKDEIEEDRTNSVLTPMSIDSETSSNADGDNHRTGDFLDIPNNKPNTLSKLKLSLQVELPSMSFNSKRFGVPETAVLDMETPISALKTSFVKPNTSGFEFSEPLSTIAAPNEPCDENTLSINFSTHQNDPIYIDFKQALFRSRNAKYFALNTSMDNNQTRNEEKLDSPTDMENVDMPTLARFLQMSIAYPLQAHMELVNGEILKLFIEELDILGHFKCLRQYFFHMNGEFGNYICDGLYKKLQTNIKPSELLNFHSLHYILDNALECSISGNVEQYANRLSFTVDHIPESFDYKSPNVLDMLSLSYHIEWPLNLILNPETLQQYSRIFNYLMKIKRLSWLLEESFRDLKNSYKAYGKSILQSADYRHVQQIRHKLAHFIYALQNHIINNIQVGWKLFKDDLETAQTMDHLYRKHTNYIKRIIFLCMLNKKSLKFHNTIEDIFRIILRFYSKLTSKKWMKNENGVAMHPNIYKLKTIESDFDYLMQYTVYSGNKMVSAGYQKEIGDFIHLININGYYTPKRQ